MRLSFANKNIPGPGGQFTILGPTVGDWSTGWGGSYTPTLTGTVQLIFSTRLGGDTAGAVVIVKVYFTTDPIPAAGASAVGTVAAFTSIWNSAIAGTANGVAVTSQVTALPLGTAQNFYAAVNWAFNTTVRMDFEPTRTNIYLQES